MTWRWRGAHDDVVLMTWHDDMALTMCTVTWHNDDAARKLSAALIFIFWVRSVRHNQWLRSNGLSTALHVPANRSSSNNCMRSFPTHL